jgi:hypothetical protein
MSRIVPSWPSRRMRSPRPSASSTSSCPSTTWRPQSLAGGEIGLADPRLVGRLGDRVVHLLVVVATGEAPDAGQRRGQPLAEQVGLHQVDDPDPAPRDLVDVGRPDAARGRPELRRSAFTLFELIEKHVVRHHQVGAVADEQVRAVEAGSRQAVELRDERGWVDDHPVAEQVPRPGVEDPRRDEVELEVTVRVDDGVTGVVAAAIADDEVRILGQVVDDPALPLVAPLGANDSDDGHGAATSTSVRGHRHRTVRCRIACRDRAALTKSAASRAAPAQSVRDRRR